MSEPKATATVKGFHTTHWSKVLGVRDRDPGQSAAAMRCLCEIYWYPLYAFARREGRGAHDAEDLVQSFLARCIEMRYLEAADESKGRFRSFLLVLFKRFLAKEQAKSRAMKRGGDATVISLDALNAEKRYALEPLDTASPDQIYERRWALTLLNRVLTRLEDEHAAADKQTLFRAIKESLTAPVGNRGTPYEQLSARLGMTEGALKVAIHRARKRYRDLLEEEIAHTVASPDEIHGERRYLLEILSR